MPGRRLPVDGEVAFVGNGSAEREDNGRLSISVNALQGPAAPEEQTGVDRPTNSREKAPYDILQHLSSQRPQDNNLP